MLTTRAFGAGMALLAGAFGREIEAPVSRMYWGILRGRLSDEEFARAVERVCAEETFWPSPAKLIQAVHGTQAAQAELALSHVQRVLRDCGGYRFLPHERFAAEFDASTKAAIRAVGGLHEFANVSDAQWPAFVKRFRDGYTASTSGLLPAGQVDRERRIGGGVQAVGRVLAELPIDHKLKAAGEDGR